MPRPKKLIERTIILSQEGKSPPQDLQIEQHVLGTIINNYHLIAKYPFLKPEVFYHAKHQIIFQALQELYTDEIKPDLVILTNYLRTRKELDKVGGVIYLTELSSLELIRIDDHVRILMDKFFYRELIKFSYDIQTRSMEGIVDPIDLIDGMHNDLLELTEFDVESQNNFERTLDSTLSNIELSAVGENSTVIHSGFHLLDQKFTFRTRYVCIIAGPEGSGKTKFVTSIVRGMLDNEEDLAVQWFSFEDDREQIIRAFLSMDVKKTAKELQSINYTMTKDDITEVKKQSNKYKDFIIEFYDRITSIGNIVSRSKRFSDRYHDKKKVIIIDNLGLIESEKEGIERDDYIAAKIKSIADTTNCSIILLHHFTKEISRKANIDDGYRPRKEYLKGSTRILDYVQQALFVNLLRKYPDLLNEEKQMNLEFIGKKDIDFSEDNFDKHLFSIYGRGDKETKALSDLRVETFVKVRSLLNNKVKFANGNPITFSDLVQKYTEYSNFIDVRNKGREDKYKSEKLSIYTFIVKRMFMENYVTSNSSPRSMYLYGGHPQLRAFIDNLFIVESIKNRDDDNLAENAIFRFVVDLGYNLFKEIDKNGEFDNGKDKIGIHRT
jgi:replicative DNA helicase